MSNTQPLSEDRLIAILASQPVPIHIFHPQEDGLYHWEVEPTGQGRAQTFEEAFDQALTYALTPLNISQKERPPSGHQLMTLDERLAVPFNEVDPATWPIDGQWPDVL